jgi:hypothetical protein
MKQSDTVDTRQSVDVFIDRAVFTIRQNDRIKLHQWQNVLFHFMAHFMTVCLLYDSVGCRKLIRKCTFFF